MDPVSQIFEQAQLGSAQGQSLFGAFKSGVDTSLAQRRLAIEKQKLAMEAAEEPLRLEILKQDAQAKSLVIQDKLRARQQAIDANTDLLSLSRSVFGEMKKNNPDYGFLQSKITEIMAKYPFDETGRAQKLLNFVDRSESAHLRKQEIDAQIAARKEIAQSILESRIQAASITAQNRADIAQMGFEVKRELANSANNLRMGTHLTEDHFISANIKPLFAAMQADPSNTKKSPSVIMGEAADQLKSIYRSVIVRSLREQAGPAAAPIPGVVPQGVTPSLTRPSTAPVIRTPEEELRDATTIEDKKRIIGKMFIEKRISREEALRLLTQ